MRYETDNGSNQRHSIIFYSIFVIDQDIWQSVDFGCLARGNDTYKCFEHSILCTLLMRDLKQILEIFLRDHEGSDFEGTFFSCIGVISRYVCVKSVTCNSHYVFLSIG
jgi:hypothetical protein